MTVATKNQIAVYNVPSPMNCLFKYECLQSYAWDDDLERAKQSLIDDKETWEKRLHECNKGTDKEWIKQIQHYIKQAERGLETLRLIDEEEFWNEQRKMVCNKVEEITEDLYYDMLECLPPIHLKGCRGFLMSEFLTGNITSQFWKDGDKYYHAYVDVKDKLTWN